MLMFRISKTYARNAIIAKYKLKYLNLYIRYVKCTFTKEVFTIITVRTIIVF